MMGYGVCVYVLAGRCRGGVGDCCDVWSTGQLWERAAEGTIRIGWRVCFLFVVVRFSRAV
jgi:hypothetical protein